MLNVNEKRHKMEIEKEMFGEDPEAILNENQYRAIRCILNERDELLADVRQAHNVLDIIGVAQEDNDGRFLLLGRMRIVQSRHEAAGMAWWNAMTIRDREAAFAESKTATVADAYNWHLAKE